MIASRYQDTAVELDADRSCMTCGEPGRINGNTWEGDRETGGWVRKWACDNHSGDFKRRPRAPRQPRPQMVLDTNGWAAIPALNRALNRRPR